MNPSRKHFNFAGLQISNVTLEEATLELCDFASTTPSAKALVVTPNADHIVNLRTSKSLQLAYAQAKFIYADGMPLVWAAKLLGNPLKERVTGADLLPELCRIASERRLRVFLFGASPGVAALAQEKLLARYPGLQIHHHCPPFGFERSTELNASAIEAINAFAPHIVFVGLGPETRKVGSREF